MSKVVAKKIISRGLQDILSQRLNSDFTAYEGNPVAWQGDTALVFTPAQTNTELPSGNDPAWDVIKGVVTGDVELTLYDFPIDLMPEILGVKYSAADGVCVGDSDDGQVWLGMTFDRLVRENGVESRNKVILQKVYFDLPSIDIKTISKDDNAVSELKLKGHAYPVFFHKADGGMGSRTYSIVNSIKNKTKYDANTDSIAFPEEFTPDAAPAEAASTGKSK